MPARFIPINRDAPQLFSPSVMEINPVTDTIMNIEVFAFIGVMVWLYFRTEDDDGDSVDDGDADADRHAEPPSGSGPA